MAFKFFPFLNIQQWIYLCEHMQKRSINKSVNIYVMSSALQSLHQTYRHSSRELNLSGLIRASQKKSASTHTTPGT